MFRAKVEEQARGAGAAAHAGGCPLIMGQGSRQRQGAGVPQFLPYSKSETLPRFGIDLITRLRGLLEKTTD
jgi:hypothetical protein